VSEVRAASASSADRTTSLKRPAPLALLLRKIVQRLGLHPDDHERIESI
jgi:hypothetical protein